MGGKALERGREETDVAEKQGPGDVEGEREGRTETDTLTGWSRTEKPAEVNRNN